MELQLPRLRLRTMLLWLFDVASRMFGLVRTAPTERPSHVLLRRRSPNPLNPNYWSTVTPTAAPRAPRIPRPSTTAIRPWAGGSSGSSSRARPIGRTAWPTAGGRRVLREVPQGERAARLVTRHSGAGARRRIFASVRMGGSVVYVEYSRSRRFGVRPGAGRAADTVGRQEQRSAVGRSTPREPIPVRSVIALGIPPVGRPYGSSRHARFDEIKMRA